MSEVPNVTHVVYVLVELYTPGVLSAQQPLLSGRSRAREGRDALRPCAAVLRTSGLVSRQYRVNNPEPGRAAPAYSGRWYRAPRRWPMSTSDPSSTSLFSI